MKISIEWIKEFTNIPALPAKEISSRFTLGTAEVEDVITINQHLEHIKIVKILEIEKHPEADKLNLVTFTLGDDLTKKVVCGAQNVKVGLVTVFAPIGVTLPNGLTLEPKKIRGVLSEGMLCSETELGFKEDSSGIIELPENAPLGMTALEYFKCTKDTILDVDNKSLTHRPDLWGHYGLAREFATLFEQELKNPFNENWKSNLSKEHNAQTNPITVSVDNDSSCFGYLGLSIDGITVGETPDWIKNKLTTVGLRSINNIVDISNYVMLELGMPNHIFDRDLIAGQKIKIHVLKDTCIFTTLDSTNRTLVTGDTVISDENGPLVLAGIMGGLSCGVTQNTKNIFIEVANWKAAEVRKTSVRLGLRSDSSQRFEKTLDTKLCERTLLRIQELVQKICPQAKVVGKISSHGIEIEAPRPSIVITTTAQHIQKVLGHNVPKERQIKIFESLGMHVDVSGDVLKVTPPSYRITKDIENEADLIEEIGRIIGFDNIISQSPLLSVTPVSLTNAQKLHRKIKDFLVYNAHAYEVLTYPMVGESLLSKVAWPILNNDLKMINALSVDHNRMRPSLVPTLLEAVQKNVKNYDEFRFFELGRAYQENSQNFVKESNVLGIVFGHNQKSPILELINLVERLKDFLCLPFDLVPKNEKFKNNLVDDNWIGAHPFEFLNIRIMGKNDGVVFSLHPNLLRKLKISGHVSMALIDLSGLEDKEIKDKTKYIPLAKFQDTVFDLSVLWTKSKSIFDVFTVLSRLKIKEMVSYKLVDTFDMGHDDMSLTLRFTFADSEKTLDGTAIKNLENSVISELKKSGINQKV